VRAGSPLPAGLASGNRESGVVMLHFSCDLCGKSLVPGANSRYVVKMEVFAAFDPTELTENDLDADHLEEISELIADENGEATPSPALKNLRYDLCQSCHQKFLADPLGREAQKFDFSEN
jgi:hypothetical protein